VTAEAAARLGIPVTLMPKEYTIGALVQALAEHYRAAPAHT
jgi:uroporphyrinogen-III synthase